MVQVKKIVLKKCLECLVRIDLIPARTFLSRRRSKSIGKRMVAVFFTKGRIMETVLLDQSKKSLLSGRQKLACLNSSKNWFLVRFCILGSFTTTTHLHIGLAPRKSFCKKRKLNFRNDLHIVQS